MLLGGGVNRTRSLFQAFTLAEMMVVLLIMSIVLAAMAPIMTQRVRSQNNGIGSGSPWKWSGDFNTYLIDDSHAHTAMIGQKELATGDGEPLLLLNSKNNSGSQILFKKGNNELGRLDIDTTGGIFFQSNSNLSNFDGKVILGHSGTNSIGAHAIGIGERILPAGNYSIAIGVSPLVGTQLKPTVAGGTSSIAIGTNSIANADFAIALGVSSASSGKSSLAIGPSANTSSDSAIALGVNSASSGKSSLAIGSSANTSSNSAIAIGYNSLASGNQGSIAIGFNKESDENNYQTVASGSTSVAIGAGVSSEGSDSIAIGAASGVGTGGSVLTATEATAMRSIAIGPAARSAAQDSIVIGYNSYSGKRADSDKNLNFKGNIAIGSNLYVGEEKRSTMYGYAEDVKDSISIGNSNVVTLPESIVLGYNSKVENALTDYTNFKGDGIAIGNGAYANNLGIAIGSRAKAISSSYIGNDSAAIAIGSQALGNVSSNRYVTSGAQDIAIGTKALQNAYVFGGNVAIGYKTLNSVSGGFNTAVGYYAGKDVKGSSNTAIGTNACGYVKGSNKTCIGANSGPHDSDPLAAEGDDNKVIFLGDSYTTVYIPGNLVVGQDVILNASSIGVSNSDGTGFATVIRPFNKDGFTAIRAGDLKGGDDNLRYYNDGFIVGSGRQSWFNTWMTSDRRLKNVGKEFTSGLDKIKQLKVFNYTFKKDENKTPRVGVIAQDLQKVFPDAISKDDKGFLMIRFEDMFYAIINAIKELDAKITALVQDNFRQDKILNQVQDDYKRIKDDNARLKKENAELRDILKQVQNDKKRLESRLDRLESKLK